MITKKIFFDGFDVTSSRFVDHDNSDVEGGRFNVDFTELKFTAEKESEELQYIYLETVAILKAYNGLSTEEYLDENLAFECDVSLSLVFKYLSDKELTNEEFESNLWFFENYISLSGKLALESLLKNTMIETIKLPWHRKIT
ncbi:hypothetical protein AB6I73_000841 [Citrobacter amalonaticus]|uniref:hypothetical protein n=1 Tax=Citrobacter TaxID=544 RepID=UPI0012E7F091|nr:MULTISPECIES: hypothetical protein [Citrobacter]EKW5096704.1 hypothetical protein [Citrobacter amalonaticus]MBJ9318959.1 hypothetical protein [Citrobacter amalonaticus]MDM3521774.1 hypothetical protein [Citrobacter sp. Ca225]QZA34825.1 hypothetical protein K1713_14270 [Citrobacter amalonaticus]HBU6574891.1 hypothetical protein [Citrobacter amalonaticus]